MNVLVIHVVQVHVPMRSPITPAIVLKLDLEVSDDSEHLEKKKIPSKNLSIEKMNQHRGIFQGTIVKKTLMNVKSGINA